MVELRTSIDRVEIRGNILAIWHAFPIAHNRGCAPTGSGRGCKVRHESA